MLGISTGMLAKLATALVNGDDNLVEKLIARKLENLGEDAIMQLIGGPLATAARAAKAVETGGASEFNRLRNQWLSGLRPPPLPGAGTIGRLQRAFEKNKHLLSRPGGEKLTWIGKDWDDPNKKWIREWSPEGGHWKWSRSRQEWLDESWRHDWRSQPRDPRGRWIEGRLKHPYMTKGARRLRLKRRKAAREAVRKAMEGWRGD